MPTVKRDWTGKTIRETFDSWYSVDDSGCWVWKNMKNPKEYPKMTASFKGKLIKCSRFSWERKHGRELPNGMQILHTCDRPNCVNPDHLFLGTNADNVADKVAKGRQRSGTGERAGGVKLNEDKVRSIRYLLDDGYPQRLLAKVFGVTQTNLSCIYRRKTWAHVDPNWRPLRVI